MSEAGRRDVDTDLLGRDDDLAVIRGFLLDDAPNSLVLLGEPGVGKTALMAAAAATATDTGMRVMRASGVEFEADVAYAALHQLLFPLAGEMEHLDPEHRVALRVALGFGTGPTPDRLLASHAALMLLQRGAAEQPLLLLMDDLQWMDRASADAVAFVARRLSGTRVRFLGAIRTGSCGVFENSGLRRHVVTPLRETAARQLLDARHPGLTRTVADRVLAGAKGNPLALLELPSALSRGQREGHVDLPAVLPLGDRLEALFVRRVADLPRPTRELLLLATLEGTGDLGVLQAAAQRLADPPELADLAPAEADLLISVDESSGVLTFRHPLTRSGVIRASTSTDRRRAHTALAAATNHSERRAWHLGQATVGTDEPVAALLEDAARQKATRGDIRGAVAALIRAAELSPAAGRARRLAEAAYLDAHAAGDFHSAAQLLASARHAQPHAAPSLHAAAATTLVVINNGGHLDTAHRLLVHAIESGDHGFDAREPALTEALHLLLLLCFFSGRPEGWADFARLLAMVRPQPEHLLVVAGATVLDPGRVSPEMIEHLDTLIAGVHQETDPSRILRLGLAAQHTDRHGDMRDALWHVIRQGRDGGPARLHLSALLQLARDDFKMGLWAEADELAAEGLQVCEQSQCSFFTWYFEYIQALLAAVRGDTATAIELSERMISMNAVRGAQTAVRWGHHARTLAELGGGDYEQAFLAAARISKPGELAAHVQVSLWAAIDLVEAALRTGRHAEAVAHVTTLQRAGVARISPLHGFLMVALAAMVEPDDERALTAYQRAVSEDGAHRWPFDLARVRLAYGERLRRARATSEARGPLIQALRAFEELGAVPWAERARIELRAARWVGDQDDANPDAVLTPQEREIALLAASGLTNRQIGERLFISHRTVGAHLYQIFPKLGISSRAALRDTLADLDSRGRG
ncbi:ATP-binding protein [Micromonospora sp. NPDC049366]|uniref:ATP-binding protein n=1 Tax=Micromonospora sp. NPDC049366 TaxID=3364271 RepID=UPI0037A2625C